MTIMASKRTKRTKRLKLAETKEPKNTLGLENDHKIDQSDKKKTDSQSKTCQSKASSSSTFPRKNDSVLQTFPAEIFLRIVRNLALKDLTAASGVCKPWRRLCKDPSLWRTVSFEGLVADKLHWNLWKRLDKLGTTCLDFHASISKLSAPHKAIPYILKRKNVTALYFGVIEKRDLQLILQHMPQLRILQVTCLLPSIDSRDQRILCDLGSFSVLKELEELKLSSLYSMSLPTIAFSGGTKNLCQLQKLRKLVIVQTIKKTLSNFENMDGEHLQFLRSLIHLEHLELGNCSDFTPLAYFTLQSLKNLKSLSLTHAHCTCHLPMCACIAPMLQEFTRLTKLTLMMCVIPETLNSVLRQMQHIQSLELWPYLDKVYAPFSRGGVLDLVTIGEAYSNIFLGLGFLHKATVGIMDELQLGCGSHCEQYMYYDDDEEESDSDSDRNFCHGSDSDEVDSDYCEYADKEKEEKTQVEVEEETREKDEAQLQDCKGADRDEMRTHLPGVAGSEERVHEKMEMEYTQKNTIPNINNADTHHGNNDEPQPSASCSQMDQVKRDEATPLTDGCHSEEAAASQDPSLASKPSDASEKDRPCLFDIVKVGMLGHLPATQLTLYQVKVNRYGQDTGMEMYYISRVEEQSKVIVIP